MPPPTRTSRYSDIITNLSTPITIIGVGAIGRQLALQLAAIGFTHIALWDHDTIEEPNCGTQGYPFRTIGFPKVAATRNAMLDANPNAHITALETRFPPAPVVASTYPPLTPIVFCCVDSMSARQAIWNHICTLNAAAPDSPPVTLFIDTRMSAEVCRILATVAPSHISPYAATLFSDDEAYAGRCTAQSTLHCACAAASLATSQLSLFLRSFPLEPDITLNLLTLELFPTASDRPPIVISVDGGVATVESNPSAHPIRIDDHDDPSTTVEYDAGYEEDDAEDDEDDEDVVASAAVNHDGYGVNEDDDEDDGTTV